MATVISSKMSLNQFGVVIIVTLIFCIRYQVKSKLTISIVSGTLQNVKDAVTDYQMLGAELVHKNWK